MSNRPRTVWIGTDTPFVLEEFRNEKTGQLITGVVGGTCKLYSAVDNSLIATLDLEEVAEKEGSYEVLISAIFVALITEGQRLRLQFEISGGLHLTYREDVRAIARVKTDDGL